MVYCRMILLWVFLFIDIWDEVIEFIIIFNECYNAWLSGISEHWERYSRYRRWWLTRLPSAQRPRMVIDNNTTEAFTYQPDNTAFRTLCRCLDDCRSPSWYFYIISPYVTALFDAALAYILLICWQQTSIICDALYWSNTVITTILRLLMIEKVTHSITAFDIIPLLLGPISSAVSLYWWEIWWFLRWLSAKEHLIASPHAMLCYIRIMFDTQHIWCFTSPFQEHLWAADYFNESIILRWLCTARCICTRTSPIFTSAGNATSLLRAIIRWGDNIYHDYIFTIIATGLRFTQRDTWDALPIWRLSPNKKYDDSATMRFSLPFIIKAAFRLLAFMIYRYHASRLYHAAA